jgi:sulfonate transport system substrate-binding protein
VSAALRGPLGTALRRGLVMAAAVVTTAACTAAGAQAPSAVAPTGALPTSVPTGTTLVVADQSQSLQSVFAASGEARRLTTRVKYANFTGGPAILEAFRAGAAQLATVGDTPPIQAHAAAAGVVIVAALQRNPNSTRLAVAPGARVSTLAQLRGKRIAYADGTAQQAIVLRALKKAGLTPKDVTLTPLQLADFPDAVRTRQVDVAPLTEPNLTRLLQKTPGSSVLPVSETDGTGTGLSYLYASTKALADPARAAAIREYVQHWVKAQQWVNTHREQWVQRYYVAGQGVSAADGRRILASYGRSTFPRLDGALVGRQQRTIDLLQEAGQLPRRLSAAEEFDRRFDAVVVEVAP